MNTHKVISFFKDKTFYSLALYGNGDVILVDGFLVSAKEGELNFIETIKFGTLEEFLKEAKTKYPVVFNFSGSGTTSKRVEDKSGYLKNVLFRSNPDDFYFYELHQNGGVFISLARKNLMDGLLDSFSKSGLFVLDFTIGPFVLSMVHKSYPQFMRLSNQEYRLIFENAQLLFEEYPENEKKDYEIADQKFNRKNLCAFAGILQYLHKKENGPESQQLKTNKEEFKYKRLLYMFGPIAVGLLIIILLLGHFTKKHYERRFSTLKSETLYMQDKMELLKTLEDEINNKTKLLQASGFDAIGYLSKYSSQIVNSVPDEILLEFLTIQPLMGRIKPGEQILLKNKFIEVGGLSMNEVVYTQWVKELTLKNWVEKLELLKYEKADGGLIEFVLSIKIKHE